MRAAERWGPVGFFLGVVALGAAAIVLFPRLLGMASGPESEIITQLKESEGRGLALTVLDSPQTLKSARHQFQRISVSVQPEQGTALVTATLDFTGAWGQTQVSSLGLERIPFVYRDGDWTPQDGLAPRLTAIVETLERRRRALELADWQQLKPVPVEATWLEDGELRSLLGLRDRAYQVQGWFIRSEREEVLVREEYRLLGALPQRPVDELGARTLTLIPRGREFSFSGGLM